jgi:hypothetical protein
VTNDEFIINNDEKPVYLYSSQKQNYYDSISNLIRKKMQQVILSEHMSELYMSNLKNE